jgi:hypothetical protein
MSSEEEMGPVDIVVIGYPPGTPQTGEALPLLLDLVDSGIVRVLDVLVVRKDEDGVIAGFNVTDLDADGAGDLTVFEGARTGLIGDEDAQTAGEGLEPGAAAVMICYENSWAGPFAAAVRRNGGELLAFHRVTVDDLELALEALDAAEA